MWGKKIENALRLSNYKFSGDLSRGINLELMSLNGMKQRQRFLERSSIKLKREVYQKAAHNLLDLFLFNQFFASGVQSISPRIS